MKLAMFTKILTSVVQRRIAAPGARPIAAKTNRLSKQQLEPAPSGRFLSDQKLLRLYEAIDLAG
jgi:hypothetical protein